MGVWIETPCDLPPLRWKPVTPCMGVWIETAKRLGYGGGRYVTPCMGVWIETFAILYNCLQLYVTPCMGVWIETGGVRGCEAVAESHPVWVCGLKLQHHQLEIIFHRHTLYGCVD